MNITIKISDPLAKSARHKAVDENLSLSGWIAQLIQRELAQPKPNKTLLQNLGNKDLAELDLAFPRDQSPSREIAFD